jgi:hypothetical protein
VVLLLAEPPQLKCFANKKMWPSLMAPQQQAREEQQLLSYVVRHLHNDKALHALPSPMLLRVLGCLQQWREVLWQQHLHDKNAALQASARRDAGIRARLIEAVSNVDS